MSVSTELDDWATSLGAETGVTATRDPDQIHPPCLFVDLPRAASGTLAGIILEVPVYIVGWGTGKQAGDGILDSLPAVLDACGASIAEKVPLTVGDITFTTYQVMAGVQVVTAPVVAPPVGPVPEATLPVDLYADQFIRIQSTGLLDDGLTHWVTFDLASVPGPNGAVITHVNQVASHSGVAWFDHGGQLGHVIHAGADLPNITLSNYIRQGRLCLVTVDSTDPAHPELVITDVYNPPTP